jgi:hypothetical protein
MGPLYPFVYVKKSQDDLLIGLGGITTRASWRRGWRLALLAGHITPRSIRWLIVMK